MSDSHATSTSTVLSEHGTPDPHGADHIAKHVRGYLIIGGILLVFTGITVALSYVDFDHHLGGHGWNFAIAMAVATFKVTLVGAIFMHLKGERPTIWRFLLFTMIFVIGLFMLSLLDWGDPIFGTNHTTH